MVIIHINGKPYFWYYFTVTAYKNKTFFFIKYVFFNVESESKIGFRRSEPENLDNPEKTNSRIIGGFLCLYTKIGAEFQFYRSKKTNSNLNSVNSNYPVISDNS